MKTILYIPIDERFATRDAFIQLTKLTPYRLLTPPKELLPTKKTPADLNDLEKWIDQQISRADILVLSAEMYFYGGLINSRISFEQIPVLEERLQRLKIYKKSFPNLKIYLSTVIMRIPAYNSDVEEPDFWQSYGKPIYDYSFYSHRYEVLQREEDEKLATEIKNSIPEKYLTEFLWRRNRNHQLTKKLLHLESEANFFEAIYLTLDDNAPFGFNKREEESLRKLVSELSLNDIVNIYPGADEVGLTVLARIATDEMEKEPTFQIIYRDDQFRDSIPKYEGQELSKTVAAQIRGAGGQLVTEAGDLVLLINNFSHETQLEARVQPANDPSDYELFSPYLNSSQLIGFADVRYTNGGDYSFATWIHEQNHSLENFAYAGWNTCGNTLGTVIANLILLYFFHQGQKNQSFNCLRFLEDVSYQALIRTDLMDYINKTEDSIFDLSSDLEFYTRFVKKQMTSALQRLKETYQLSYELADVFFPWQRTFEIGFSLEEAE